jgi:hypothetical protein
MKTIETIMEPFIWNYTQTKGTTFSRLLLIDADLTGAEFNIEISGPKAKVKPLIKVISIKPKETLINISLTAQQTADLAMQNKWFMTITYRSETFICWKGDFNLRSMI